MESNNVVPSTFALVGAAAMSCGATQTISAAVVRRDSCKNDPAAADDDDDDDDATP